MTVNFLKARDGNKTCTIDGAFYTSSYAPIKEAERFCSSIETDFTPSFIFVIAPIFSYTVDFLHQRFPSAKICSIQIANFEIQDDKWDFSYTFDNKRLLNCDDQIIDDLRTSDFFNFLVTTVFPEENAFSSLFVNWINAERFFSLEIKQIWNIIKLFLSYSRDIFGTRCNFNKRWSKNSLKFSLSVVKCLIPERNNSPIVIAASGPDLKDSIDILKTHRKKFFLIALSSAIYPLLSNSITPDLCLTTDGGYWAQKHLYPLLREKAPNIPIAMPPEASIPAKLFQTNEIIPLSYQDGADKLFIDMCELPFFTAYRNGTVSGTAILFALSITTNNIFFIGLDLANSSGFQHTLPNELESDAKINDRRLFPLEKRIAISSMNGESLAIYRDWFETQKNVFQNRVYRITTGKTKNIDTMINITYSEFTMKLKDLKDITNSCFFKKVIIPSFGERINKIEQKLIKVKSQLGTEENKETYQWLSILSLFEFVKYNKYKKTDKTSSDLYESVLNTANKTLDDFLAYISKKRTKHGLS